ncbi:phosphoheptose isomerase [Flavobacterium sp. F-380]|uniref:Phosphoheptose isomerase n=1 Tax=Flavobacterium kayseriense TaxID=2764714 RepID=A0ABR7J4Y9_9FLAO|nr:phosphoheptose isomerase [Flavobacterium kayseriense]MBC5840399.1 phosphoheptose isomerase [Flavobacterium kayseriense]MBC5846931.1 phosphoheptose isomerase [Flavobacterium kayseriense]MBU0942599.1 phosphoheptose isomerase [Bacteroidota bacterium]
MNFNLDLIMDKNAIFERVAAIIKSENFTIVQQDMTRPWGGFFVIAEDQASAFAKLFFPNLELSQIQITNKLSPKILVVAPNKRLSWQYHYRRSEIWKIIGGKVGVKTSLTDEEGEIQELTSGAFIQMDKGERHRLIGLDSWGIVAEIWQHTDLNQPSDEEDIVRLQDDFGR